MVADYNILYHTVYTIIIVFPSRLYLCMYTVPTIHCTTLLVRKCNLDLVSRHDSSALTDDLALSHKQSVLLDYIIFGYSVIF